MFLDTDDYELLCSLLDYRFKNENLLQQAITRKSGYLEGKQEKHIGHNERLEFLGDSVLRAVIDDILIELHRDADEAELSDKRDELVSKHGKLYHFSESINLQSFIILGKGEAFNLQNNGKKKILSDVMEAIIGALFIDSSRNYQRVKRFIIKQWGFLPQYNRLLVKAITKENVSEVKNLLDLGVDPETIGETAIYKDGGIKWGKDKIRLFSGEYAGNALQLAILSKRVVREVSLKSSKPSPGRWAYLKDGYIYMEPLELQSVRPTLEDLFTIIAPIDLGSTSVTQNLILAPEQPGYDILQDFFSPEIAAESLEILKLLLAYGADPNKKYVYRSRISETALHTAAYLGNAGVIKLLLENGANVNITDNNGDIPASQARNKQAAELLMPLPVNSRAATASLSTSRASTDSHRFFKHESTPKLEENIQHSQEAGSRCTMT
jgi:dsRNA-specific ribonuclease